MVFYINEFNIIVSQLTSVKINFNDEVYVLILLMSLSNTSELMKETISNYVGKETLQFNDIKNKFLLKFLIWIQVKEHYQVIL